MIGVVALAACGRLDFDDLQPAAPKTWWDTSYTKRAQLTVHNVSADPMTAGFQVETMVNIAQLDGPGAVLDGLRVVYLDPATQMWTEQLRFTETNWMWFALVVPLAPGASTTDYWFYFGNPSPQTPPPSGPTVFDFFDAFANPSVNTSKWGVMGTPTQANNRLSLKNGDSIRSLTTFGPGNAVFANTDSPSNPEIWMGLQRSADFVDDIPWYLWIERNPVGDTFYPAGVPPGSIWPEVSLSGSEFAQGTTGARLLDGTQHLYTVERVSDRVVFKFDEQDVYEYMTTDSQQLQIRLTNYGSGPFELKGVHVARAVWPEPVVTIGTTELQ